MFRALVPSDCTLWLHLLAFIIGQNTTQLDLPRLVSMISGLAEPLKVSR